MAALRQQAVNMLNTLSLPEEMILDFIQRMQAYQQEQEEKRARKKLNDLMNTFRELESKKGEDEALRQIKSRYGSLSKALSGIISSHTDIDGERYTLLKEWECISK